MHFLGNRKTKRVAQKIAVILQLMVPFESIEGGSPHPPFALPHLHLLHQAVVLQLPLPGLHAGGLAALLDGGRLLDERRVHRVLRLWQDKAGLR